MKRSEGISFELKHRGVAASTIREALGPWILSEPERLVRTIAAAPSTLEGLVAVQADAKAFVKLKRELDNAIGIAEEDE
jgi:hypothetical protein